MKFINKIPKLIRIIILLIILLALILITLIFVSWKNSGLTFNPTPKMISRIESTGRDATCADLIGKWLIRGDFGTWEFREDGTFVGEQNFFEEYRMVDRYTCDDSTKTANIPFCGPGESGCTVFCCITTRLGRISDDRMVIYEGGYNQDPLELDPITSRVLVIERK